MPSVGDVSTTDAFAELERAVEAALQTYANVHRGSGHRSLATSALLERAREIVLEELGLDDGRHTVVFGTPMAAALLQARLPPGGGGRLLSSEAVGLPLGLRALVVETRALPPGPPPQSGGGAVRLVLPRSVVWAEAPERFEAGTPAILNAIAFARALQIGPVWPAASPPPGPEEAGRAAAEILHHDELAGLCGRPLLHRLRQAVMGRGLAVPTEAGPRPFVNLDHAASTPALAPVWTAVRRAWRQPQAVRRELVGQVRALIAAFLGAPADEYEVLFTANTTEAINLVARSFGRRAAPALTPVVLTSVAEHHSNELPWRALRGAKALRLPVDGEGVVDLRRLEAWLEEWNGRRARGAERIRLLAVSGASNVLGSINDLEAIGRLARRYGARLLVDAAQRVAHRPIDMGNSGIDYLAFSAHKMYAPFGSGALVARRGLLRFEPAERQAIQASGEENVAGIAALGKAIVLLQRLGLGVIEEHERVLTRRLLEGLARIPGVRVYGLRDPRSERLAARGPVVTFGLDRVPHNRVARELAEEGGIGVRHGCFCAHLLVRRLLGIGPLLAKAAELGSRVFPRFMGAALPGLVRVSLGLENDEADVERLLRALRRIAARPRPAVDRLIASLHGGMPFLPRGATLARMEAFGAAVVRRVYRLKDSTIEE